MAAPVGSQGPAVSARSRAPALFSEAVPIAVPDDGTRSDGDRFDRTLHPRGSQGGVRGGRGRDPIDGEDKLHQHGPPPLSLDPGPSPGERRGGRCQASPGATVKDQPKPPSRISRGSVKHQVTPERPAITRNTTRVSAPGRIRTSDTRFRNTRGNRRSWASLLVGRVTLATAPPGSREGRQGSCSLPAP